MKEYKRNCCAKRSVLEKILIVVIVLLLCLLIALFAVFVLHLQNGKNIQHKTVPEKTAAFVSSPITQSKNPAICMSHDCIQAASQILDFIDSKIDPCDDFYSFVCGKFANKSLLTNEITPLSQFEAITLKQIDALITEDLSDPLPKSLQLQKKYYKMCMDTEAIETDNTETFSNLIKKIGDWPVLHGRFWDERKFNWLSATVQCRKIGFGYEHFLGLTANAGNTTGKILLSITPPAVLSLPYQIRDLYIDVMGNISIELGAPPSLAKNEFIRVYKFEDEIRSYVQDEIENGEEIILSVSKLQDDFPTINWIPFLNQITSTSSPFTENSLIRFRAGRYLINLLNLLDRTPKSTQANYVVWKIIENFRSYLKESIRSRYEGFLMALNPDYAFLANRHLFCLNKAKFYFPSVAELAYVRKYLKDYQRNDIKDMTGKLKAEFIEKIKKNEWIDLKSKNVSINNLLQLNEHIGASDQAYSGDFDKNVDMDGFNLNTDNIMEMATKLYTKRADNYFKIVNRDPKAVVKEALETTPILSVNAFFNEGNTLVVPVPFLQGVIYNFQRPQYLNFGALGSIIGHELVHCFMADKTTPRWTPETQALYNEKIQCLLDDYKSYIGHTKKFTNNSRAALEENLADLIGPQISYEAYQTKTHHGIEPTLPGLPYTQNQLFWIASGMYRCYQPKLTANLRFDQNHAAPTFAAVSSLRNSKNFARDFKCPAGSQMNPTEKCQIL